MVFSQGGRCRKFCPLEWDKCQVKLFKILILESFRRESRKSLQPQIRDLYGTFMPVVYIYIFLQTVLRYFLSSNQPDGLLGRKGCFVGGFARAHPSPESKENFSGLFVLWIAVLIRYDNVQMGISGVRM
jgi:hypothetical protein